MGRSASSAPQRGDIARQSTGDGEAPETLWDRHQGSTGQAPVADWWRSNHDPCSSGSPARTAPFLENPLDLLWSRAGPYLENCRSRSRVFILPAKPQQQSIHGTLNRKIDEAACRSEIGRLGYYCRKLGPLKTQNGVEITVAYERPIGDGTKAPGDDLAFACRQVVEAHRDSFHRGGRRPLNLGAACNLLLAIQLCEKIRPVLRDWHDLGSAQG